MVNIELPMPAETPESLWPETFEQMSEPLPVDMLRQQGNVLKQITNGKVEGAMVNQHATYGSKNHYWQGDFFLLSGTTDYGYRLLSIRFDPMSIFPVTIETEAIDGRKLTAKNETEYRDSLRTIFHSDATKRVVRFIMESLDDFENPSEGNR